MEATSEAKKEERKKGTAQKEGGGITAGGRIYGWPISSG